MKAHWPLLAGFPTLIAHTVSWSVTAMSFLFSRTRPDSCMQLWADGQSVASLFFSPVRHFPCWMARQAPPTLVAACNRPLPVHSLFPAARSQLAILPEASLRG